jgi:hypothetical protein
MWVVGGKCGCVGCMQAVCWYGDYSRMGIFLVFISSPPNVGGMGIFIISVKFFSFFAYLIGYTVRPHPKRLFRHFSKIKESDPKIYMPSMIIL